MQVVGIPLLQICLLAQRKLNHGRRFPTLCCVYCLKNCADFSFQTTRPCRQRRLICHHGKRPATLGNDPCTYPRRLQKLRESQSYPLVQRSFQRSTKSA
ncbi:hypothetical protein M513_03592 [Trichuris suis]|uniref:Uncharacterized protein n=1 Tax=Trichuris suis TaxID=68888 RepID=A0A085ME94_9BILA|nr:hypothetical protein M513_03592 [Trichuris suis]